MTKRSLNGRWFPPGSPVSSTRKLISSSSFHRLDMTLAVAEALTPNKPNQSNISEVQRLRRDPFLSIYEGARNHEGPDVP